MQALHRNLQNSDAVSMPYLEVIQSSNNYFFLKMYVGSQFDRLKLFIDTSSASTWLKDPECIGCPDMDSFYARISNTKTEFTDE
jgi:hypothetical protein